MTAVLKRITRFLVSSAGADLGGVLAVIGDALEVESVYFIAAPDESPNGPNAFGLLTAPMYLKGQVVMWTREGGGTVETLGGDLTSRPVVPECGDTLGVPLLADDERLVGYLGLGPSRLGDLSLAPYDRVLSLLGDVLGTHLGRLALEEARSNTEDRWRQLVDRHLDPTFVVAHDVVAYANAAAAALLGAETASALVGMPLDGFVSAEDIADVLRARDAQLRIADPVPFEHAVIRMDGDVRTVESVSAPFSGVDGAVQTVLRDLTDRRESEARYRAYVQTTSDGVWRVRLDRPVARGLRARVQAEHVLRYGHFAELNPAMTQAIESIVPPPRQLSLRRLVGPHGPRLVRALVESGYNLRGFEIFARQPDGGARHFSISAIGRFERDDLVEVWGSCTEITERVEMERRLVAVLEDHQERIARDLHDSVGQLLTGVRMMSESLSEALAAGGADPAQAATALRISAYSAEALDRVRAICHGLVPPQLYSEGAAGALAEFVEHVDQMGPVRCVFRRDDSADLPDPDAALQAYRIAQEAVSNALRHGGCEVIWVTLGCDGDDVVLEVEDDGHGFDLDEHRTRSIGLYGMRRRANSVGATFTIETSPGHGTTVRTTFPGIRRARAAIGSDVTMHPAEGASRL